MTLVPACVYWKRRTHSLATYWPFTFAGANSHRRAALKACSAKYLLGPGESKSAATIFPVGSTRTLTLTRTVPRMVSLAFWDTSGRTWSRTSPGTRPGVGVSDFSDAGDGALRTEFCFSWLTILDAGGADFLAGGFCANFG